MSKYTFICEHWDGGKVTVEQSADGLSTVLEAFEFFLKGAGFILNGQVDIVPEDDNNAFSDDGISLDLSTDDADTDYLFDENVEINLGNPGAALHPGNITVTDTFTIK